MIFNPLQRSPLSRYVSVPDDSAGKDGAGSGSVTVTGCHFLKDDAVAENDRIILFVTTADAIISYRIAIGWHTCIAVMKSLLDSILI